MKNVFKLSLVTLAMSLAACSSSDDNDTDTDNTPEVVEPTATEFGPFSTGTTSDSNYVYFDLDTGTALSLTEEEAAADTQWDIAFKRTNVYLNTVGDNPVQMYYTGNNADFYDEAGAPVTDNFVNATAESELEDYEAVDYSSIPTEDSMWNSDKTEQILAGFYNYNSTTHQVTAANDKYYIVQSDSAFTKFRVSQLTQAGFAMSDITFAIQHQTDADDAFPAEQTFTLDLATLCSASDHVYVDFETQMEVDADGEYEVMLTCSNGGADFDLALAEDATAIQDFDNVHSGVSAASAPYYGFQPNQYTVKAFSETPWYSYNLQGGHLLWSQYGVYIIKTETSHYKVQFTSYYDEEGTSGNYSFRADELVSE